MNMPVGIMHDSFADFLIPGIILLALGVLTTISFFSVLRKSGIAWLMGALSIGGLAIWFLGRNCRFAKRSLVACDVELAGCRWRSCYIITFSTAGPAERISCSNASQKTAA
jgi:hypothetical protein